MILDDIAERKKITLEESNYCFDILRLFECVKNNYIPSFYDALAKKGLSIIGEVKKASPSRGVIKEDFNPVEIAEEYEKAVDAISVLTEEYFFMGSPEYLKNIHNKVSLPVLRKDFIISPLQIFEARELGASAVLLIAALLKDKRVLKEFIDIAHGINIDALVEVHNENELETALCAGAKIIGINNRNLFDFSEDINTTVRLSKLIPSGVLTVSESSIHTPEDIKIISEAGVSAVLVGESFMRCDNIVKKAEVFKKAYEH